MPQDRSHIDRHTRRRTALLLSLVLVGLVGFLYAPVTEFGFVSMDDPYYIQRNTQVQEGLTWDGVVWAFTERRMSNWHPLTWISHMVDVELFGDDAGGHHAVNVAWHGLNAALLLWVLLRYTKALWRSVVAAALFALHPLRVESVAWATERKDVLSAALFLLTLLAYERYARGPSGRRYAWVFVCFAAALLCKSMVLTLPAVLLLLDVWPLRRVSSAWARPAGGALEEGQVTDTAVRSLGQVLLEKGPLLLLSFGSALVTLWAAADRATSSEALPLANRLATPAIAYIEYLSQAFWPKDLACFYPLPQGFADGVLEHWVQQGRVWAALLAGLTIAVLIAGLGRWKKTYLLTGWFWFLGMLVPVIGILQVGSQVWADRFSYLPHMGLVLAVVWGVHDLLARGRVGRVLCALLGVLSLVFLAAQTRPQVLTWRNSFTLFSHAVAVTENNALAHDHYGRALERRGDSSGAELQYRAALKASPSFVPAAISLARVLAEGGQLEEAEALLRSAGSQDPSSFDAHFDLAQLLLSRGRVQPALGMAREAHELRPNSLEGAALVGQLEVEHGDLGQGIELLKGVLERQPDHGPSRAALREARRRRRQL